jgi:acetyl/propionyl-CoA carboxylase alpha subunit
MFGKILIASRGCRIIKTAHRLGLLNAVLVGPGAV